MRKFILSRAHLIPIFGIFIFSVLYFIATFFYPGGTEVHPEYTVHKLSENYLCDLMSAKTYSGKENPAQTLAVLALSLLTLSFIPYWRGLAKIFNTRASRILIGHFGALSMIVAALVFTPMHDLAVYISVFLGFTAFGSVIIHIRHHRNEFMISFLPVIFMILNFIFWHFKYQLDWLPLIQKGAFLTFFIWVIVLSLFVSRINNTKNA